MEALEPDDPRSVETAGRRYRLLARVGGGGMGVVYLARTAGGRTVAIKMVHQEFADDRDFRERFRREVDVARSVGGGFTAPVIDADTGARVPWLVTEFLPSVSVRDAVRGSGALPVDAVWELAAGIAEALVSIHAAGVVHRDLKPANVLLTANGPRVIDFGIARAVDAATVTRPGIQAGSPGFMSPEQVAGTEIGPPSDIFSLGSTLAYARTGEEPFGAGMWDERMLRIQRGSPRIDGITDDALRTMIASCMDRDPSRRPTAAELTGLLASVPRDNSLPPQVAAEIVKQRNAAENPPVPRRPDPHGRRRTLWLAAAGAAAVAIAVPTALWYDAGGSQAQPTSTPTLTPTPTPLSPASQGPVHKLRFSLTGNVRVSTLTYTVNTSPTTLKNVRLPWHKTVTLPTWPPRSSWKFAFRTSGGTLTYTVEIDGRVVDSGSGDTPDSTSKHLDGVS